MDHYPDIRFVYTHAERIGGDHNPHLSRLPAVLFLVLFLGDETGVIVIGGNVLIPEHSGDFPATFPRPDINYGAP